MKRQKSFESDMKHFFVYLVKSTMEKTSMLMEEIDEYMIVVVFMTLVPCGGGRGLLFTCCL